MESTVNYALSLKCQVLSSVEDLSKNRMMFFHLFLFCTPPKQWSSVSYGVVHVPVSVQ